MTSQELTMREMDLGDVGIRIDYFHGASDDDLRTMGVDRALLPTTEAWMEFYENDYARPIRDRLNYSLAWELAGQAVGFSSTDQIIFGETAFMHLHILRPEQRRSGLGVRFVTESA